MNESSKPDQILRGHESQASAYIVDDYPYGFRLRCKIRYWLESNPHGTRLVNQTTNPKVAGEVWNKPKASTYTAPLSLVVLYIDQQGHVQWTSVAAHSWPEHIQAFKAEFLGLLNAEEIDRLSKVEALCRRLSPNAWAEWDAEQAAKKGN